MNHVRVTGQLRMGVLVGETGRWNLRSRLRSWWAHAREKGGVEHLIVVKGTGREEVVRGAEAAAEAMGHRIKWAAPDEARPAV
jgi:hypothetical protein